MFRQLRQTALRATVSTAAVVGLVEVTTHLPSQGRSSPAYHWMSDRVVTPLLRSSVVDPETAHGIALECARRRLAPTFCPSAAEQSLSSSTSSAPFQRFPSTTFPNAVGLAAGLDKDGVAIQSWLDMGFGFVEIGSVTPEPQPGNPKPRLFRLPLDAAIVNRYGFNSLGADAVECNLSNFRKQQQPQQQRGDIPKFKTEQPEIIDKDEKGSTAAAAAAATARRFLHDSFDRLSQTLLQSLARQRPPSFGLVGINLGKNKTSEDEIADYRRGMRQLGPYADYVVINVSSPNTPGLRDLQQQPHKLEHLLRAVLQERDALDKPIPLLVKLAPDLTNEELTQVAKLLMELGVDGVIVCNTTTARPASMIPSSPHNDDEPVGGLSGAPLKDRATECIRLVYHATEGKLPIVGVGGVSSGHDAYEKLKAGASLIQVYSCMVYEGPGVVSRIRQELAELMLQNGQRRLQDVVGLDHDDIYWQKREEQRFQRQSQEKTIVAVE